MQRTEISSLGEFALIKRLTRDFPIQHESTRRGVGDDAAVIAYPEGLQTLVTTDLLLEGIHFDLTYTPLRHLGYKAAVGSFSDIYAMNGHPQQLTCSVGVSARFAVEDLEELYAGIRLACSRYGVDLVGGDTSASLTGLCISITCLGAACEEEIVYRSGAQPTDLICVSGNLGAAYMGLLLALREKGLRPTSMIDSSDGLASELLHLATESGVGVRIYEERLPIDIETHRMAEELNMSTTTVAMNGGEDFELIFTIPLAELDRLKELDGIHIIGHVTSPGQGCYLVTPDGAELRLRAQGWPDEAEE